MTTQPADLTSAIDDNDFDDEHGEYEILSALLKGSS